MLNVEVESRLIAFRLLLIGVRLSLAVIDIGSNTVGNVGGSLG